MSDIRDVNPDDEREVVLDDDADLELPPPTLDAGEQVEEPDDDLEAQERESAIEAGEIDPA